MASSQQQPSSSKKPLYPQVLDTNPESNSPFLSGTSSHSSLYPALHSPPPPAATAAAPASAPSLYPTVDMSDLVENLFPDPADGSPDPEPALPLPVEETILRVPGAIVHLVDKQRSVELATGDLDLLRLRQGDNAIAVLARVADVQWPLARDAAAVRLDDSHYFFSLPVPPSADGGDGAAGDVLSYGLTFASKGQERLLDELDGVLQGCCSFSLQKVAAAAAATEVLDGAAAKEVAPSELIVAGPKKEMMEERSAAYWTTLAPNVEDYSGLVAKGIAMGSGQLIKGILWCGDVTVDRLKWGDELLKKKMGPRDKPAEISPEAMRRIKRVKRVSKMSEKVATGILSGVVKVSGFFTSSVVNSKAGKKFFGLLPGEVILASLDGFGKICDAVEVAGKNVFSTSSTVTTGLVSHRYGEKAGEITNEGLDAAGHAMGTAWAVFKIRKALNPKSTLKPTSLAKSAVKAAAADMKAKQGK